MRLSIKSGAMGLACLTILITLSTSCRVEPKMTKTNNDDNIQAIAQRHKPPNPTPAPSTTPSETTAQRRKPPAIIPQPVKMTAGQGEFVLTGNTAIYAPKELTEVAKYLAGLLAPATGYNPSVKEYSDKTPKDTGNITLALAPDDTLGQEGYRLTVTPQAIEITAPTATGVFYGCQTLRQLLPVAIESKTVIPDMKWSVGSIEIEDYPRFAWRGLLFDVSRHFFTKQEVMSFIDTMARYKFNTFHWHLTDDPGWRIEIKKYPELTEIGAWRVPRQGCWGTFDPPGDDEKPTYGGFYTQDDIREVVAFAKTRFITIVPEIDVPGHSMAALASYPQLSCTGGPFKVNPGSKFYEEIQNTLCVGNEDVYKFLDELFTEVAGLFPGRYIHMGGDEATKKFWAKCPKCEETKKQNNLKDQNELQSWFVKRTEKIIESKGKLLIGWDEILEGGLAPNATVMSWRGIGGGVAAAKMGHKVVMTPSPYYYLDLYQGDPVAEPRTYSMSRLNTCYGFEPVPDGIDPKLVLGVQGNLWTEEISELRHAQYMAWPRAFAIAETGWSPKEKKNWTDFVTRLEKHFERFDSADIKYAKSVYDVIFEPKLNENKQLVIELKTEIPDLDIYYTFEGAYPDNHYPRYTSPLQVPQNAGDLTVITCRGNKPIGRCIQMSIDELRKRCGRRR